MAPTNRPLRSSFEEPLLDSLWLSKARHQHAPETARAASIVRFNSLSSDPPGCEQLISDSQFEDTAPHLLTGCASQPAVSRARSMSSASPAVRTSAESAVTAR